MTSSSFTHRRSLDSHRLAHKAEGCRTYEKDHHHGDHHSFEYQQEQCLRALRVAQMNSKLFTTALTSKVLYGSGKFDDDMLNTLLDNVSQAMDVANQYTKANTSCILNEEDDTTQDSGRQSPGYLLPEKLPEFPPSA